MMFNSLALRQTILLLLVVAASCTWSDKASMPKVTTEASSQELSTSDESQQPSTKITTKVPKHPEAQESKPKFRYSGHSDDHYILDEDDGGKEGKEFEQSEEHEEYKGQEEDRGYNHGDKKVDDKHTKDYYNKGAFQDFTQGGATFDKHHKDRIAENKENENVKEHDEGAKFGSEAVKEHKLGKHKEKSKGHKKHGFKNVYHKEEYGDHKTFHDEFLDNDHFHDYDDAHEHKEMQGGRFSKGYKREGANKEFDEGDENHAWGKEGHDGDAEGHYEKGGHLSGHHHGHKKHEGHHEASGHKTKHSAHKVKKGEVPHHSSHHGSHHGAHQPQYYAQHHGKKSYSPQVYSKDITVEPIVDSHHHRHHSGHYVDEPEPYVHTDKGYHPDDFPHQHEERTSHDARRLEVVDDHQQPKPVVVFENQQKHIHVPKKPSEKSYSFHHKLPPADSRSQQYSQINKPRKQLLEYDQQEPHRGHHQSVVNSYRQESPVDHHHSAIQPIQQHTRNHQLDNESLRPQLMDYHRSNFANQRQPQRSSQKPLGESQLKSEPYPWWQHSRNSRRHHHPNDPIKSSSHLHAGYAKAPEYSYEWAPRMNHHSLNNDHVHSASHHHHVYPGNDNRRVFKHHHHHHHTQNEQ